MWIQEVSEDGITIFDLFLFFVPGPGLDQTRLDLLTPEAVADLLRSGAPMEEAGSSFLSLSTLLA